VLNGDAIRAIEHESIRRFVRQQAGLYAGSRVLDYGCGRQPYREIIETAGGEYVPWDRAGFGSSVTHEDIGPEHIAAERFDVILCTQVIQYMPAPDIDLVMFSTMLRKDGHLVLTGPTNWPEVEPTDRHRFTLPGARELVEFSGFEIEVSGTRAVIEVPGWNVSLGWGIVGRR
jgi:SAM-dependent methyltransferase